MRHALLPLLILLSFSGSVDAFCFKLASEEFQIDWRIIYAIATVESNMNATAVNFNRNSSIDIGVMQINSIHQNELASEGISMNELLEPCKNVIAGTWLLKKSINNAAGDVWKGVGYYHSATPEFHNRYIRKVRQAFNKLEHLLP
ncbi:MAG TPA: lytic transglycosylase domain-containing protein [Buttiauxella sp.]